MLMADGPIELLSRARAGETDALGEICALYRNYLRMVVRTGLGPRLRERVELSDVVQEALVEVVRQFPQFTGESEAALVGWLRRLVGQKLADLGRYHSRAKRAGASTALPLRWRAARCRGWLSTGRGEWAAAGHAVAFPDKSQRGRQPSRADRAPGRRPGRPSDLEADVIWLYYAESLSFEAIGQRFGLSRKSIRGIMARGFKRLKRSLEGPPGGLLRYNDGPAQ